MKYFPFTDDCSIPVDASHGVTQRSSQTGHDGERAETHCMIFCSHKKKK